MLAREDDAPVQIVETHASWVFLTPAHAWKIKKSRFDAERLHAAASNELEINHALAPSVYLGCLPFYRSAEAFTLAAQAQAHAAGWILKMRRLPIESALAWQLTKRPGPDAQALRRVAQAVAGFHRHTARVALSPAAYRQSFLRTLREDFRILRKRRYRLARAPLLRLQDGLLREWRRLTPLLLLRAHDSCLIEGHGDLRAEHVYLEAPVLMIDRLDLSARLRTLDPWDEAAFLALDCRRLGGNRVARQLLADYAEQGQAKPPPSLLHFYQAVRACTRARLAITHLDEARYRGQRKWRMQTRRWLSMAEQCLENRTRS